MKILLFSHIADCDGITPVILSKLVFEEVDYILLDNPVDEQFRKIVKEKDVSKYDLIFMTDLCISSDIVNELEEEFKNKFLIFDHHIANLKMNQYDFITVMDEENDRKQCGTSLYYQYLLKHYPNQSLRKKVTETFVNLVRLGDTWTWQKENNVEAIYLADYLAMVGVEAYISYFYHFIEENEEFFFEEKLKYLFEIEEKRKQNYIEEKDQQIISVTIKPYHIGVVFAENYRSSVGNALATKYKDQYDFIIIVNVCRSISYRGVKDINLSDFATLYGGKGHLNAAGSPLPKNLRESIIKQIFKEVVVEDEK